MARMRCLSVVIGAGLLATALAGCGQSRWRSELVSANAAGSGGGNRASHSAVVSPDGTKIAFMSLASDLGPTDTVATCGGFGPPPPPPPGPCTDIYLRDRASGTTTLVTANAAGTDSANNSSQTPIFSPDGSRLAFMTRATDLGATDHNLSFDVYVHDLATGTTTLVTANATGTGTANAGSLLAVVAQPVFSPDGTRILFESGASDLVAGDTNNLSDVFVRDLTTGTTQAVSLNAAGTATANGASGSAVFSPDGTTVAFTSTATDLGPTAFANESIYVRDLAGGTTVLASADSAGNPGTGGWSFDARFSPDGTSVAFTSNATNLVPHDGNGTFDAFVHDLGSGATTLVSAEGTGTGSGNDRSTYPVFSPDGEALAFLSEASDLGPTDGNGLEDIYVRDLATGETSLVSSNASGTGSADGVSGGPVFDPGGDGVLFWSTADDLVPGSPGGGGLYLRDLGTGTTRAVSTTPDGTPPNGAADRRPASFGPDGTTVVYTTAAGNLGPPDQNGSVDVYLAARPT